MELNDRAKKNCAGLTFIRYTDLTKQRRRKEFKSGGANEIQAGGGGGGGGGPPCETSGGWGIPLAT